MFWFMCRMNMGVGSFERPNQRGPSKYLKHLLLISRKCKYEPLKSKSSVKMGKISIQISQFREEFLKYFCFFLAFRLINASYDHGIEAFENPDQGGSFRYLKHIDLTSGKVFTSLWSRRAQSKWAKSHSNFEIISKFEMRFCPLLTKLLDFRGL